MSYAACTIGFRLIFYALSPLIQHRADKAFVIVIGALVIVIGTAIKVMA